MKKIIPFKKDLVFKTKVSEITSISLEHTLDFVNDDEINGEFTISGDYKMTEGSINRENFLFKLPFDIVLDSRYKKDNISLDVDDFYYEIINNEILRVNIEVFIDGDILIEEPIVLEKELTMTLETEKSDNDRLDIPNINIDNNENINTNDNNNEDVKVTDNIFDNIDNKETYTTYHVYIMKEEDNLESILTKYNTTKEALEDYNDLSNLKVGDKVIIPTLNE